MTRVMIDKARLAELGKEAAAAADQHGMCSVRALRNNVRDNRRLYRAGEDLHMHKDLVPLHVMAGQVELHAAKPPKESKEQTAPADKQARPGVTK